MNMKSSTTLTRWLSEASTLFRFSLRRQTVSSSGRIAPVRHLYAHSLRRFLSTTLPCSTQINDSAQIAKGGKSLVVNLGPEEGEVTYHPTWLRHNCQCSACLCLNSQKTFDLSELTPSLRLESAHMSGDRLELVWSNGHHGYIEVDWLRRTRSARGCSREEWLDPPTASELPVVNASELLEDKETQWMLLHSLSEYGVCLLTDYGTSVGSVREIPQRVMYAIRPSFYGEIFNIEVKEASLSQAQSTMRLKLHSDYVFYDSPPGLQMNHCLRFDDCVEGGESEVVDFFAIAEELRDKWPEHFSTLTRVPATFQRIDYGVGKPVDMILQSPHILLDNSRRVADLRWCPAAEGPLDVPEEDIEPYFAAYHCLVEMLASSNLKLYHRLRPGEVLIYNNRRMVHSRNEFTLNGGHRHLQGTFVDMNHFTSAFRVLRTQLNKMDVPMRRVFSVNPFDIKR